MARLHQEMRACRRCLEAGFDIVPGAVFRGGPAADVLLIGQAPGVTEVEAKRPFNAGSGRRLFQWLGQAGWEEDEFRVRHYMTAVAKCYPGRSPTGKGDRVPSKREQQLCRPFLDRELALVRPRLIILIGRLAIGLLYPARARLSEIVGTAMYFPSETGEIPWGAGSHQGQTVRETGKLLDADGRWVVPLPHPSGASLWPNRAENKQLIGRAIRILSELRTRFAL